METYTVVFVVVQDSPNGVGALLKAKRLRSRTFFFFGAYVEQAVKPSPYGENSTETPFHLFSNLCPFKGTLLEAPIHAGFDESFPTFGERPFRLGSP